ncbi:MAG: class I SAM-dependent methyltransferase [Verrucomicrobiota bacterium]
MPEPLTSRSPDHPGLEAFISKSIFWTPLWVKISAWLEHIPFAFWIVEAAKPRLVVELGTHHGASYMALCQSVKGHGLDTKCFAVDTWKGDDHAGRYGENVFAEVSAHNHEHYREFSTLIRSTFDEALASFADGSIDLLHIDGCHTYDAVAHDFEKWFPKLSSRAVVLFHDTAVRDRNFGVYKLWDEIKEKWPSFEFVHGSGLGVLGVGPELPERLRSFFEAAASAGEEIRALYHALGSNISFAYIHSGKVRGVFTELERQAAAIDAFTLQRSNAKAQLDRATQEEQRLKAELKSVKTSKAWNFVLGMRFLGRLCSIPQESSALMIQLAVLLGLSRRKREIRRQARELARWGLVDIAWYRERYERLPGSYLSPTLHYLCEGANQGCDPNRFFQTTWYLEKYKSKISKNLNPLLHYIRQGANKGCNPSPLFNTRAYLARNPEIARSGVNPLAHFLRESALGITPDLPVVPDEPLRDLFFAAEDYKPRVIYITARPQAPGHIYRVEMYANALAQRGYHVHVIGVKEIAQSIELIESASVVVIWRADWNLSVSRAFDAAKRGGAKVMFDLDDLMVDPSLVSAKVIDAIRFRNLDTAKVRELYSRVRQSASKADFCSAATHPLASAMRRLKKPTFVLPNGFDEQTYLTTRRAVARRRLEPKDGLLRIGYAGGTQTHQKDFGCAAPALARILREHPECRVVLFRAESEKRSYLCLDPSEYPEFVGLENQIEWKPLVPLRDLPNAIARFDINLAPLEHGNPFCEAKSELKYFEAALANVPTIASPTVPFAGAIRHGETGFLAQNDDEWYECLHRLVGDPQLRHRIGEAAFYDVYWRYGPERRAELVGNVVEQIIHEGEREALAFQLELFRQQAPRRPVPRIPDFEVVFESGTRVQSQVAVVISLYNYGRFVEEALESVRMQTLAEKDLIVVDDCSTDDSLCIAQRWIEQNKNAFCHVAVLKNRVNSGLDLTRNAGFSFTDAPFIMVLDADNLLEPACLEKCLDGITRAHAATAYPMLQKFGNTEGTLSGRDWTPICFAHRNGIDAMAMIRRSAWAAAGGYQKVAPLGGWQDYDLWCRFVELGFYGVRLPEVLARYRVHGKSMLHTSTNLTAIKQDLVEHMRRRHPWVDIPQNPE